MKLLSSVKNIINSYNLIAIDLPEEYKNVYDYLRKNPEEKTKFQHDIIDDLYLLKKYEKFITPGHYGFSVGDPIVKEWYDIIDKVLETCVTCDPDFEIHQIKMKFGGIRFYCASKKIEDLHEIELLITRTLHDKALIY